MYCKCTSYSAFMTYSIYTMHMHVQCLVCLHIMITCNMTRGCEGECLNEVSFGGWGQSRSSRRTSRSSSGFRNGRTGTAGTDKIRRSIRPLHTLCSTHAVTNVEAFERLTERTSDALHARHVCSFRSRAVEGGLDVDDVAFQEIYHCEPVGTTHCQPARELGQCTC